MPVGRAADRKEKCKRCQADLRKAYAERTENANNFDRAASCVAPIGSRLTTSAFSDQEQYGDHCHADQDSDSQRTTAAETNAFPGPLLLSKSTFYLSTVSRLMESDGCGPRLWCQSRTLRAMHTRRSFQYGIYFGNIVPFWDSRIHRERSLTTPC
jgi:hypothetical protein